MATEPLLTLDQPWPTQLAIGKGQFQFIYGAITWADHRIASLSLVQPDGAEYLLEVFPGANDSELRFVLRLAWIADDAGKHVQVSLSICDAVKTAAVIMLGETELVAENHPLLKLGAVQAIGDEPLVAICMATYAPKPDSFFRQLESIICQSHENWVLLIVDDASPEVDWTTLETLRSSDPRRIHLFKHRDNLGFYNNFERALSYVPENADFIAFADQDDIWYPDKLQKLISKLQQEHAVLAYSDMRVVHESGEVLSDTYWQGRKNEYRDFDTLLMANTVTGAASVFERELLDTLLPFPKRIGDAFHDHWLACTALTVGKIAYVNTPLYDYIQYGDSVIGHCDFTRWTFMQRIKSMGSIAFKLLKPKQAKAWLGQKIGGGLAIYQGECLRLQTMANTLKMRLPSQAHLSTLNIMNGGWGSSFKLLKLHLKILFSGRTTDDAEFRLAMGFAARELEKRRQKIR